MSFSSPLGGSAAQHMNGQALQTDAGVNKAQVAVRRTVTKLRLKMITQKCDGDKQMEKLKSAEAEQDKVSRVKTDPELKGEQREGSPQESHQICCEY